MKIENTVAWARKTVVFSVVCGSISVGLLCAGRSVAQEIVSVDNIEHRLASRLSYDLDDEEGGTWGFSKLGFHTSAMKPNYLGLSLRGPGSAIGNAPTKTDATSAARSNGGYGGGYVDPWAGYEQMVSVTYRNVKYVYGEDGVTPVGIVEVLDSGEEVLICRIAVAAGEDGSTITTLKYPDEEGFDVIIRFSGLPDWTNLLASASIAEGIYYRMNSWVTNENAGTKITKVHNVYDENGSRTFAIMKSTYFDQEGKLFKEEVTKERSYYNRNGDLERRITYCETNGRLTWVSTLSRLYIRGTLFMEVKSTLDYNEDKTIKSSTLEQTMFDKNGLEARYSLVRYEEGHKAYSVKRVTDRDEKGEVTCYFEESKNYDGEGNVAWANSYERRVELITVDGTELRQVKETSTYEGYGWNESRISIVRYDSHDRVVYSSYSYHSPQWAYEAVEQFIFDDETGDYTHTSNSTWYDQNGNIAWTNYWEEDERYDAEGRLVMKRDFRRNQRMWHGELVTAYESETITDYEYDADRDLVREHEHGYWFSTYVDPYSDKVTTFLYGAVNGIKNLINKHITHVIAEDGDFVNVTYYYDEDTTYEYDQGAGGLESVCTNIFEKNYYNNILTWERELSIRELYDNGNLASRSTVAAYNGGQGGYLELVTYSRYEDGSIETVYTHREELINGIPYSSSDEVIMYNRQGNLTLRSLQSDYETYLEQREYYSDGKTLKSVDIVSDGFGLIIFRGYDERIIGFSSVELVERPGCYPNGHYELHETYREDGLIAHREELQENNNPWWVGWGGDVILNADERGRADSQAGFGHRPWWGWSNTRSVEDWEYTEGGTLTHYKREYTSSGGDWWYSGDYTEKVERFYDPETGRILQEAYSASGCRGWRMAYIFRDDLVARDIPENVNAFAQDVTAGFFSGFDGQQEMKINYTYDSDSGDLTNVEIKWIGKSGAGADAETMYSFFASAQVDKDGKIQDLVVREGESGLEWIRAIFDRYPVLYERLLDGENRQSSTTLAQDDIAGDRELLERKSIEEAVRPGCGMAQEKKEEFQSLQ